MRLSKYIIVFFCLFCTRLQAQYDQIEEGYFEFPIQPGRVNYLSGSMGELRADHFHAGIDIKTNGKEGFRVHAAAEGYISRIKVSAKGYGNCLYLAHPNGTTTVYAHLQKFATKLAEYVLRHQYERESFEVNLFPERNRFKVKKGEVIGLSGNSGSSGGPHLHFEIRNARQEALDPLRFRFSQIKDNIPPLPRRIALKTMDIHSRINGKFGRFEYPLQRRGNDYIFPDTLTAFGNIGIEIWAYDKLNGARNRNGIPIIQLYDGEDLLFGQNIDTIRFSHQKNIHIHTNYQVEKELGRRYSKLYIDDGNGLQFYDKATESGILKVSEGTEHPMSIGLADAYGNQRKVLFHIKGDAPTNRTRVKINPYKQPHVQDNTLMMFDKRNQHNRITLQLPHGEALVEAAYSDGRTNVFLWDLRVALPQKVIYDQGEEELRFDDLVPAAREHRFLNESYSLKFGKNTLFDTVYIQSYHGVENGREILEVNRDVIPLKGSIEAEITPLLDYDSLESYHVYQVNKPNAPSFVGGEWQGGKVRFDFNTFGKFTLLSDRTPPAIQYRPIRKNVISFTIKDDLSGIKTYKAELDGAWLLMNYDKKRNLIWSERRDKTKPLSGEFTLTVSDYAGNKQIFKLKL